jgi:hypothetical protein
MARARAQLGKWSRLDAKKDKVDLPHYFQLARANRISLDLQTVLIQVESLLPVQALDEFVCGFGDSAG